uniref:Uncharacterized protein n=1 Tax=Ditylenchus dipsaci TaxID=166011 RepID=A0A915DH66_9BILA
MRHKKEFGTSRALFQSYISDFVWRKKFNGPDIMFHLWSQIAELEDECTTRINEGKVSANCDVNGCKGRT